jgi:cardiolipin synthase (CMP-forming)
MGFSASSCIIDRVLRFARHIPNVISAIRIALVVPIAITLARHELTATMLLFAAAALSDAADGFLARHFGWQSELGGVLDPVADKLLLATVFITSSLLQLVPLWLMAATVARDAVIVLGAAAYRFFIGPLTANPSFIGKFNTVCQAAFIFAIVVRAKFSVPPAWVTVWLGALVFATVVVSGIDYVLVYGKRAAA